MAQTHHLRKLQTPFNEPSTVFWATKVPRALVLFVHGFGGSGAGTWPLFPDLLPQRAEAASADVVFYQYDGRRTQSNNSALDLYHFLDLLLPSPLKLLKETLGKHNRPAGFEYRRIIIVAHSLGAVITRRALLYAHRAALKDKAVGGWLNRVRLVLFAPAHRGAYAAVLAGQVLNRLPWYLGVLGDVIKYQSPLVAELTPGSTILTDLENDTKSAHDTHPGAPHLVARQVLWAKKDKVVINADFCFDPTATSMPDRDHSSVCKPRTLTDPTLMALVKEMIAG